VTPDALGTHPALWLAAAYLVGGVPVGLLIARARGVDLRAVGSGNIGATNAVRALGGEAGALVFALDFMKAAAPVWLASRSWALGARPDGAIWIAAVGLAAVLGHVFPVYLRFRGGKGVACALGIFAVLEPAAALCCLVLYGQTLALTRVSAIGSLTGVSALTLFVWAADRPFPHRALAVAVAVLIWARHRENLKKLRHRPALHTEQPHDPAGSPPRS
jgi:glycerol-3-phosphate acyltransferase PlsY